MRISTAFFSIWLVGDVLALTQYQDIKIARQDFDPSAKIKIPSDDVPSILLRRGSGPRPLASDQGTSLQRTSSGSKNGSAKSNRTLSPARPEVRGTGSNNSNNQIPQRETRTINRSTGTQRDLVRSVSPPRERARRPWRQLSSSPPMARKIRQQKYHLAHPADRSPSKATIGMIGPGVITHQHPSGEYSHVIVPPKKAAMQEADHSTITLLSGKVFSQGTMLAGASGVKAMSSLKLKQGHGFSLVGDGSGKRIYAHTPASEAEYWIQKMPLDRGQVSAEAYVYGAGEATVIGCNDPTWCNHVWGGGGPHRPDRSYNNRPN